MARNFVKNMPSPAVPAESEISSYLRSWRKRTLDLALSLVGILITAITFPVIALLIKIDSRGPIFYRQTRLGMDSQPFTLVKFRTMVQDAEANGEAIWSTADDPRITRIGRILRRLYIDEFPQWWNVLRGEMSIVGPRPERPEMVEIIIQRHPGFLKRLEAKPGVTGLAQTEYGYASSIDDSRRKLRYDVKYMGEASMTLDLWMIIRTVRKMAKLAGS